MSFEILYTSAPEGLRKGSQGYCTVVSTRGIPKTLAERLEMRGGYPHPFSPGDPKNPVNYSHLLLTVGGVPYHLLSRVADCGYDYSQRSNKLAHHVALAPEELTPGGPAWVLAEEGFCETKWDGKTRLLENGRTARSDSCEGGVCHAWERLCGDPGWAGVLAENAISPQQKTAYVVFKPDYDVLPLVVEAMSLIPPEVRWQTTFSTYYTKLQAVESIRWCFVLDGSQEANSARRDPRVTLIDLCDPTRRAPDGPYVEFARTGKMPLTPEPKEPTKIVDKSEQPEPSKEKELSTMYGVLDKPPKIPNKILEGEGISGGFSGVGDNCPDSRTFPKQNKSKLFYWRIPAALAAGMVIGILLLLLFGSFFQPNPEVGDARENTHSQNKEEQGVVEKSSRDETPSEAESTKESDRKQNEKVVPVAIEGKTPSKGGPEGAAPKDKLPEDEKNSAGSHAGGQNATTPPNDPVSAPPKKTLPLKEQLPDWLDLPKPNQISKRTWPLDLAHPEQLEIKLLGSNSLAMRDHNEVFTIEKETLPDNICRFTVYYKSDKLPSQLDEKTATLGYFELESGELSFNSECDESLKGRYEVFRYHLLGFSYNGENHICRLLKASTGKLVSHGRKNWATWTFQTVSRKTKSFKRQWEDKLPANESLKLEVRITGIKDCADGLPKKIQMIFRLDNQRSKPIKITPRPPYGDIQFGAELVWGHDSDRLLLTALLELKELKELKLPHETLLLPNEELDLRKHKTELKPKILPISKDSIKKVKLLREKAENQLEQIKYRDPDDDEIKKRLDVNKANANIAIGSANKWLNTANKFQNELPKLLWRGKA